MLPQSRGIAKRTGTTCASLLLVATCFPATKYVVDASCPAIGDALRLVIIGNSYTGGTSVGRACDDNEPGEPACHNMAVPGDVANFDVATYPGIYNRAPDANTLADPSMPYHPSTNPHRGDVPGKMKLIAEHICGAYLDGPVAEPASAIARHRSYIRRFDDHSGRDNIFVDESNSFRELLLEAHNPLKEILLFLRLNFALYFSVNLLSWLQILLFLVHVIY